MSAATRRRYSLLLLHLRRLHELLKTLIDRLEKLEDFHAGEP